MTLDELVNSSIESQVKIQAITPERLLQCLGSLRKVIAFYRYYPDLLVDFMVQNDPDCTFHFYFYQRIFLRVVMRHRYVYMTFPRAYSKSFLSMMALMIRCVLYPNSHLFVTTGGKERICLLCIIVKQ